MCEVNSFLDIDTFIGLVQQRWKLPSWGGGGGTKWKRLKPLTAEENNIDHLVTTAPVKG